MKEERKVIEMSEGRLAGIIVGSVLSAMAIGSLSWYAYGQYKINQMKKQFGLDQVEVIQPTVNKNLQSMNQNVQRGVDTAAPIPVSAPLGNYNPAEPRSSSNEDVLCTVHGNEGDATGDGRCWLCINGQ